jgi:hypothetical protein
MFLFENTIFQLSNSNPRIQTQIQKLKLNHVLNNLKLLLTYYYSTFTILATNCQIFN